MEQPGMPGLVASLTCDRSAARSSLRGRSRRTLKLWTRRIGVLSAGPTSFGRRPARVTSRSWCGARVTVASFSMENTSVVVVPAAAVVVERVRSAPVVRRCCSRRAAIAQEFRFAKRKRAEECRLNTSWTSVGPPLPIFAPSVGDIAFPSNMAAWIPCRAVGMDVIDTRCSCRALDRAEPSLPPLTADHQHLIAEHHRGAAVATSVVGPNRPSTVANSYTSFSGRAPTSSVSPVERGVDSTGARSAG
jgi:hypothetical protein